MVVQVVINSDVGVDVVLNVRCNQYHRRCHMRFVVVLPESACAYDQLRTQHKFHHLPAVTDANYHQHTLVNNLPSSAPMLERAPSQLRSQRTQVHHMDVAGAMQSLLEQKTTQIHHQI